MWSEAVVIILERFDFLLRIVQREEPIHVQTLISEASIERLDKRIIGWFSRSGEAPHSLLRPLHYGRGVATGVGVGVGGAGGISSALKRGSISSRIASV